mgnify:CR=1 FL=1
MGTRARRQEHGRRPHRPHRPPRTAHQIRGPLLPKRTRPHDQITNTTQTGSGRYRTPCGKPAAYTAEKHRSQSGRQLAKTQAGGRRQLGRQGRIAQPSRAARGAHAPRVRMGMLHEDRAPTTGVIHPRRPAEGRKGNDARTGRQRRAAYGTGIDWNEFHTTTRYPNTTD